MLSLSESGCFKHLYRSGRQAAIWAAQAAQRRGPLLTDTRLMHALALAYIKKPLKTALVTHTKQNNNDQKKHLTIKQHVQEQNAVGSIGKLPLSTRCKSLGGDGPAHRAAEQEYLWPADISLRPLLQSVSSVTIDLSCIFQLISSFKAELM